MAKVNNYQTFSQVDYCISQYYSKYMASTLVQEKKRIEKNQTKELMDAIDKESGRSIWAQAVDSRHGVTPAYRAKSKSMPMVNGIRCLQTISLKDVI